jgi:hypothetical protein
MVTQSSHNPFIYGPMIRDAQKFFGRIAERRQLINRVQTMQHTSIVGERRIGKSSLLFRLYEEAKQAMLETAIIYSDLPDVESEAGFYACVCRALNLPGNQFGFNDLKRAIERKPAVLCLDEFETVCADQKFSINFFNSLRSLAQTGKLSFVVATQHPLADLCRDKMFSTSEFWNIFTERRLGLIERDAATTFITEQSKAAGHEFTSAEIGRLIEIAGLYPFFLQMACAHLFEEKTTGSNGWQRVFEKAAKQHFRYLWENLGDHLQRVMRWMTEIGGKHPDERLLEELMDRGLIIQHHRSYRGYCPFSEAFEGYIKVLPKESWWERFTRRWVKGYKAEVNAGP